MFVLSREVPRISVRLTAYLLILATVYGALVVSDFVLARYEQSVSTRANQAASLREAARRVTDERETIGLRAEGFRSLLYPALFDSQPFLKLVEQNGIAPLAPQPKTSVYYCNEGYGLKTYTTDRFGFRNQDQLWESDSIDIVLIGDSYAQGACVDDDKSIAGILSSDSRRVLNLATAGNGPIHYAALSRTFLKHIRPRFVIVVFYANDNVDEAGSIYYSEFFKRDARYFEEFDSRGFPLKLSAHLRQLYREASALLSECRNESGCDLQRVAKGERTPRARQKQNVFLRGLKYLGLPNTRQLLARHISVPTQRALPFSTKLAVDETVKQCRWVGCTPIFVYIPNSAFWRPDYRAAAYLVSLKTYVSIGRHIFVDTTNRLAPLGLSAYAPTGPHLSEEGYEVVAEAIRERISLP